MEESLRRLQEAVELMTQYNKDNNDECIRMEVCREGFELTFKFRTASERDRFRGETRTKTLKRLVTWRNVHQARRGTNPIMTALDEMMHARTEYGT